MWSFFLSALALAVRAQAQSGTTSALPTTTVTVTATVAGTTVTTAATLTTTSTVTLPSSSSSSTTSSDNSVVTNQAYIDTVLRHHNQHRLNHSSPDVVWDSGLAEIARKITTKCVFDGDLTQGCPTSDCYGQSPAAGYPATEMGGLISEGFYNPQANNYIYYGEEPDKDTYPMWGYMTQIIWKTTASVGCYTADCSAQGLTFPEDDGAGVAPYFTICNYKGPGNYYGNFTADVLPPVGLPTILGGYECRDYENCVNSVANGDERAGGDDGNDSGVEEGGVIESKKRNNKKRKNVKRS